MKKLFLLILLLIGLQNYAFSQRFTLFKKALAWNIGPTFTNWTNYPADIDMNPARNIGAEFSAMYRLRLNDSNTIAFHIGPGLSFVNLHTNVEHWDVSSSGQVDPKDFISNYKSNKLVLTYLELPVEFVFKPLTSRGFRIGIGFRSGVAVDAHTRKKEDHTITKVKSFENLQPYRYGPTLRLSYNHLSFYGMYDLQPTFKVASSSGYYQLYTFGILLSTY